MMLVRRVQKKGVTSSVSILFYKQNISFKNIFKIKMSEYDDEEEVFQNPWDARSNDPDEPLHKTDNWRELLLMDDIDRIIELMKQFRWKHRQNNSIRDVEIENTLKPIVTRIPHLKYKNPDMLVLGYAAYKGLEEEKRKNENDGILTTLTKYIATTDRNDKDIRSSIVRYARLIKGFSSISTSSI
jgi:hypothetical protein